MKRFLVILVIAASVAFPAAAARRRAVSHASTLGLCTPGVIASGFSSNDVAVDATWVYFGDDTNGLFRITRDGNSLSQLATIPDGSLAVMTMDDQNLYFFSDESDSGSFNGNLYSLPKSGGMPVALATGVPLPLDVVVDATSIYWTSLGSTLDLQTFNSDGKVEKINKDGTGRLLLASGLSGTTGLGVDDNNVWFGETGLATGNTSAGLRRVPKTGGAVTHLTDGDAVAGIVLTSTDVWFSTTNADSSAGALLRASKAGGTSATIASGATTPVQLRITGPTLYYIAEGDTTETITSIPLDGGTPASLKDVAFWNETLAIDDCSIYYPIDGAVERISR